MDPKKRSELQLVTNGAFGVNALTDHIDANYKLKVYTEQKSTPSGDLRLFEIEPELADVGSPAFSARWDHTANTLDFDLIRHRSRHQNFQGHHTTMVSPGVYEIDIHVGGNHIFKGSVTLRTELGLRVGDSL